MTNKNKKMAGLAGLVLAATLGFGCVKTNPTYQDLSERTKEAAYRAVEFAKDSSGTNRFYLRCAEMNLEIGCKYYLAKFMEGQ